MHVPGVLRVYHPRQAKAVPLLVDSPHSGRVYPDDFGFNCPVDALRRYEDRFVDLLLTNLPHHGITVVQSEVPRTYIDLNRAETDISFNTVRDQWHAPFTPKPTSNSQRGTGLIWTRAGDHDIYNELPKCAAVLSRIERYYWPYYQALEQEATALLSRFGRLWHLNIHSMPPTTNNGDFDVVLGDLDGRSCDAAFSKVVADVFEAHHMRVVFNKPYKGAHLTRTFGRPAYGSESLQIEMSKGLYLKDDLVTLDRDKFMKLQNVMDAVCKAAGQYARAQVSKTLGNSAASAASSSGIETRLPKSSRDVTP